MTIISTDDRTAAADCSDQLPLISRVGRGIKGDSARVRITGADSADETYLEGGHYDEATKTFVPEWTSGNINGGELTLTHRLNEDGDPRTFTFTLSYRRPGHTEWSWTSPAIPYVIPENQQG